MFSNSISIESIFLPLNRVICLCISVSSKFELRTEEIEKGGDSLNSFLFFIVTVSDVIQPIALASGSNDFAGQVAQAIGIGMTSNSKLECP